jgi:RimJ/RimL family protein N-acetyltransferase
MFDYIVCFYFGNRRTSLTNFLLHHNRYGFVKRHIDFLEKLTNTDKLNTVIFVVNGKSDADEKIIKSMLSKSKLNNYKVIMRDNVDYSYGAWNEAIIHNLNSEAEYAFLLEDDYIPANIDFYKYFLELFDENTAYVCQYYGNHGKLGMHAAISNGFIDYKKCRVVYEQKQTIFKLIASEHSKDYVNSSAEKNQISFLDHCTKDLTYIAKDITKEHYSLFLEFIRDTTDSKIKAYGNTLGNLLVTPIMELPSDYPNTFDMIELRKINENDLIFVNSVRNGYAKQYLHDSREFTLDETIEWFNKSNPDFYIIEFNGEKIGYFRLSNHSIENKSIYIGADIAPEYKGNGFGKISYKKFIPFIFKEYDLNTIILEVLATNTVAISLYEKLGFKQQSIKVNEVKKGDELIDSIVMSISRDEYESI